MLCEITPTWDRSWDLASHRQGDERAAKGRRPNGFLGLSLNKRNTFYVFLETLLDKSDKTVFALGQSPP